MKKSVLIAEDEPGLQLTLADRLQAEGYETKTVSEGYAAERAALGDGFDAIVLDVMLPGQSGLDVCSRLRRQGVRTPILMLTALDQVDDRVRGLKCGADDYLGKPFEMKELLARIEALVRRAPVSRQTIRFGPAAVDFGAGRAWMEGEPVELSARLLRLLAYLVEHAGQIVTRDQLLNEVWGHKSVPSTRTVDVHVAWLRRALEANPQEPRHIITVRGSGYRFDP